MFDMYETVTNRIIEKLEKGCIPWRRPWVLAGDCAVSRSTGKPYSFLNQMLLDEPGEYVTYQQCVVEGGHVRKGAKSKMIVFWKLLEVTDSEDEETTKKIPTLRYYNVFNVNQCEGLTPKHVGDSKFPCVVSPVEQAETIINDYCDREGVRIDRKVSSRAYYDPADDAVTLPLADQFVATAEYYGTAFHELTHSTGHAKRLDRLSDGKAEYAKEELVAEIGSAAILNKIGLETESAFENSAAYINGWLTALKNDKRMIISAASRAEKAVALILGDIK